MQLAVLHAAVLLSRQALHKHCHRCSNVAWVYLLETILAEL